MKNLNVNTIATTSVNLVSSDAVLELLKSNTNLNEIEYVGTTHLLVNTHNYLTEIGIVSVIFNNSKDNKFAITVSDNNVYNTLVGDMEITFREELDSLVGMELITAPNTNPYYLVEGRTGSIVLTPAGPKVEYGRNSVMINLATGLYTMIYQGETTHGELDTIWEKTCIELVNKIMS